MVEGAGFEIRFARKGNAGSNPVPSARRETDTESTRSARAVFARRGDRVVEGARLEIVCAVKGTEGSNPSLSAQCSLSLAQF